jgi:hypothetical protein
MIGSPIRTPPPVLSITCHSPMVFTTSTWLNTHLDALQSANGRNTHSMLLDTRPNGSDTHFDALEYAYARLTNCPFTASLVCRAMSE